MRTGEGEGLRADEFAPCHMPCRDTSEHPYITKQEGDGMTVYAVVVMH